MKYLLLAFWALAVLWQHKSITKGDRLRLFVKTYNLFLCFLAFADKERPFGQLRSAMICAILSALYDYDTDWVKAADPKRSHYAIALESYVSDPAIREGAMQLFERDWNEALSEHGLERGPIALSFYHALIRSDWLGAYASDTIAGFGRSLQIVDDVLDLKKDRQNRHTNCFLTDKADDYAREVKRFLDGPFFRHLEANASVYRFLRVRCEGALRRMTEQSARAVRAAELLDRVKERMLARDPKKYGAWWQKLDAGRTFVRMNAFARRDPYFKHALARLGLIFTTYAIGREIDDIADGDAAIPYGWTSASGYVAHLLAFVRERRVPADGDELEFLLSYVIDFGDDLGMDIRPFIEFVLRALLFDALRREQPLTTFPQAVLDGNNFLLDEEGTIGLCLIVLGESRESFDHISLLGIATRTRYTLRDLLEDMRKGICNVSREDFEAFGMYMPDVTSELELRRWYESPQVRAWRAEYAGRGLQTYSAYDAVRDGLVVHHYTLAILEYLYERDTRSGLEGELKVA